MTRSHSRTAHSGTSLPAPTALTRVLQISSVLSVLTVIWQGATAGALLERSSTALAYHGAGAIVLHVFTAVAAVAAFLLWRASRAPLWPTVLGTVVFLATLCQAALGDRGNLYVHVPLALLLMLGIGWLLTWSFLRPRAGRG